MGRNAPGDSYPVGSFLELVGCNNRRALHRMIVRDMSRHSAQKNKDLLFSALHK